ncbi:colicin-10 [Escherichia coli]|uniref:pore-forming bacteriocin colicin E1 n=1 Tax=Escherichia coli TaxID=562 RepID=UPI000DCC37EF|nr:pore-forming bacteriocin colicin E1 [Escherichia coli]RAX72472.1 colicin-10 [Escherichia coli]
METAVAYYKDGVPYDDKGQVIITLLNGTPDGSGSGGGGGKGGSKSESSAAIHATAKWSTAQLKKTQAEQAARAKAAAEAQAKAKANRDALTQRLKDIVNEALRHNASRTPSATELAHANNAAMQAEAERLRLAKAEEKARKEAEAAEKAFQEAEQRRKEIEREKAETERQLKLAEAEEKRLAALSEEAKAVEIAQKKLSAAQSEVVKMDGEIKTLNSRLSSSIHARDAEMKTLAGKRNELAQASAKYKELDELVKKLSPRANDPLQNRPFFEATRRRVGAGKIREEKQKQVTASETRINRINADITQIQKAISQVSNNRNAGIARVHEAEENLKKAQNNLLNSQIKDAVDATVSFYQTLTEKYGEKYSKMAQELADKSKGKKFSKADRDAIFNALASVKYDDWAKHLDQFAKYLKITGHVSFGYDVVSDILKIKDTGDWKPLFLTLEKKAADAGVSYVVALLFSLLAGTTLGIWGIAIVTGILCSYIDKNKLNTINEVLGI